MFDVIVIGGGVIGGLILRELTKYTLSACLVEKEYDVCMGASKANSGLVHAGFDALSGTLKAKFNVLGNKLMQKTATELGVKYKNNGALVVAFSDEELVTLEKLKERGERNGVPRLRILDASELKEKEPNISDDAKGALYAPTSGIVCPYELTIAAIGNAMDNGAELITEFEVCKIERGANSYRLTSANGQTVEGKVVINCAGLASGRIAELIGDLEIQIKARKGEYILLDRESSNYLSHTLFFTPTEKGKGILLSPTVDGNVLFGPTAEELENAGTETTSKGLSHIMDKVYKMCKNPPFYNTITSFAGVRAYSVKHDFIIEESKTCPGFIHCAGIESPGLTAAPAIAQYVVETLTAKHLELIPNVDFNGYRAPTCYFKELSDEEKNKWIKKDPSYGKIVCRCEQVTEGEILQALRQNPKARDIDGVKRRTRTGMGRCQGGFCQPQVAELIAKEYNIPLEQVTKKGGKSLILTGVTK